MIVTSPSVAGYRRGVRIRDIALPLTLLVTLACGSSSSSAGKTVKDQAGRTCTVPPTGLTISCDPQPQKTCSGGASACFVTGVADTDAGAATIGPAAVCAACCSGNSSTSGPGDCSQIVCKTADDCPQASTKCNNGGCY
jgi:hypothetical protein